MLNRDRLAGVDGADIETDKIDLILKAIDDSQKQLSEKFEKEMEELAPLSKVDPMFEDLDSITRRLQNAERNYKVMDEKVEDNI